MADIVTASVCRRMLAGIRSRNTKLELVLRKGLHTKGFRLPLHKSKLPRKPNLVFAKHQATVLANGFFWDCNHCQLFRWPSSRPDFWKNKNGSNKSRELIVKMALAERVWRILLVWECANKSSGRMTNEKLVDRCTAWLTFRQCIFEIRGA